MNEFLKPENETKIFQLITQSTGLGAIKIVQSVNATSDFFLN